MSSDLLKILRSLKEHSDHRNHYDHNNDYGNHHDRFSGYGHHYKSHGKHSFTGLAGKVARELSGKLLQNKRLTLLVIIGLLTVTVIFLVCAVWIVFKLINLYGPLINDIEKNGLKGVVETVSKMATRIWEGSGK